MKSGNPNSLNFQHLIPLNSVELQVAIARGVEGNALKALGEAVVAANEQFKTDAKHVRMHIGPSKAKATPKATAKAKASAA